MAQGLPSPNSFYQLCKSKRKLLHGSSLPGASLETEMPAENLHLQHRLLKYLTLLARLV